ncbi:MAG: hypothetical protein JRJ47_15060, partial [Deltaproteobacteria bacterium]|nr:hypothetical protein [Deltaproteobacteria bacterium]
MARARSEKGGTKQVKSATKGAAKRKTPSKRPGAADLGIKKQYLKSRKTCKVTFRLPRVAVPNAKVVCIVG